jgi:hypothetical protein
MLPVADRVQTPLVGLVFAAGGYGWERRKGARMSEVEAQRGDGEIGKCHVCGQEFPTQEELSKHLMDVHEEDLLPDAQDEA